MTPTSAVSSTLRRWLARPSLAQWTALALAMFGAAVTFVAYRDYVMEDAYITYRYAQNLAAGHGFVFNPGERVLGTSTPLYAMVLGLAGLLGLDIAATSGVLFSASLAATALLGAGILRRYGHPALSILFATIAIWGACDVDFFFGMEIPFYLMLLFASFRAALDGRRTATGLLVGLAFLTRYDAAVFAVSLFAILLWRNRKVPWREGLCALGVVAPWLVFAQLYFGSVFPNTLAAKTGEVKTVEYMFESVVRQIYAFLSPFFHFWPDYLVPKIVVSLLILTLIGPIFAAARRLFARERLLAHLLVFPVLLWLGYSWIAPPLDHYWYLTPGTYFLLLLSLLSWGEITRRRRLEVARPPGPARLSRAIRALPIAALALVTLIFLPQKLDAHAQRWMVSSFYRARTDVYLTLARWIKDLELNDVSVLDARARLLRLLERQPDDRRGGPDHQGHLLSRPRRAQDASPTTSCASIDPASSSPRRSTGSASRSTTTCRSTIRCRRAFVRAPLDLRRALSRARGALAGARRLPSRSSRAAAPSAALELRARRRFRLGDRRLDHRLRRSAAGGSVSSAGRSPRTT